MACAGAALGGHLAVLQWVRAQGCPWDKWTCAWAAEKGHLAVLQWARAQGCPWDEKTCSSAAENGHLAVLQWARAQGCPWNKWTCILAAQAGQLAALQWARAQGCPWDEETCTEAAALVQKQQEIMLQKMSAALASLQLLLKTKPGMDLNALVQQQQTIMLQMTADMEILQNLQKQLQQVNLTLNHEEIIILLHVRNNQDFCKAAAREKRDSQSRCGKRDKNTAFTNKKYSFYKYDKNTYKYDKNTAFTKKNFHSLCLGLKTSKV